jgi:uncharacterized protein (TIGR02284 family)
MDNAKIISTLNSLIETSRDGEQGFRTAAEGITDPQVRTTFQHYAQQRAQFVRELQQAVSKLGGSAENSGSMSGSMHRGWMKIKEAVTGKDDHAIIAEAERGEDVAKAAFDGALREDLPRDILALVERMAAQVREAHDRVRALEHTPAR